MTKEETFDEAMEAIEAAYSTFNNGMLDCTRTRHRFRLNPKAAEIADFKEMIDDYIRTLSYMSATELPKVISEVKAIESE